jgi:GTP cyclohydrolase I
VILEDVQARPDHRQLPIDEVGISGIRYPVTVWDRALGKQETIAEVTMSVDVSQDAKGAHLSRFVEVLHDSACDIGPDSASLILHSLKERLGADRASLEFSFPYFLRRLAPVTGSAALLDYQCRYSAALDDSVVYLALTARVPVTSVCPCSKAISDYGAHNQRSHITIQAHLASGEAKAAAVWFDDLIEVAEASASSPVFPVLKRPDERHVTMQAHDKPVFVEDMARDVARTLMADQRIAWFSVEAASDESIHNHDAFARIYSPRTRSHPHAIRGVS